MRLCFILTDSILSFCRKKAEKIFINIRGTHIVKFYVDCITKYDQSVMLQDILSKLNSAAATLPHYVALMIVWTTVQCTLTEMKAKARASPMEHPGVPLFRMRGSGSQKALGYV